MNNPHILPIFAELARRDDLEFRGVVLQKQPWWRVELGWPELPPDAPYIQPWRSEDELRRYRRLARQADLVIWPGLKHPWGVWLMLDRNLRRRPNVVWAERFLRRRKRPWLEDVGISAMIRILNNANMSLMTLGEGAKEDYLCCGAARWRYWRFGYAVEPVEQLETDFQPPPEGVRLLFVGALEPRKGVDILLRALGRPDLARLAWSLCVVGSGSSLTSLQALANQLAIASRVHFVGKVRHDDVRSYYRDADVLVLPSRFDGWGAVVNEAMEHGLAVVASDAAGCARLLIEPQRTGYVLPREAPAAWAECLRGLIANPAGVAAMRRASRERIALFRPDVMAARAAALFRGLTGHGPMPEFSEGWCSRL